MNVIQATTKTTRRGIAIGVLHKLIMAGINERYNIGIDQIEDKNAFCINFEFKGCLKLNLKLRECGYSIAYQSEEFKEKEGLSAYKYKPTTAGTSTAITTQILNILC